MSDPALLKLEFDPKGHMVMVVNGHGGVPLIQAIDEIIHPPHRFFHNGQQLAKSNASKDMYSLQYTAKQC